MRALLIAALTALFVSLTPAALAEPIFSDDFQDNNADGWAPSGGDVRLTSYGDNISLRLTERAAVVMAVSTRGFHDIAVSAALAGASLEGTDHCRVEVSADGGRSWRQMLRVSAGMDDGVTLHRAAVNDPSFANLERLLIGARILGDEASDQCWLDEVRVAGVRDVAEVQLALSREILTGQARFGAMARLASFAPSAEASAPLQQLRGVLSLAPRRGDARLNVHRDDFGSSRDETLSFGQLPAFAIDLVSDGDRLIPVQRGPRAFGHPLWEIAFEPGRIWSEADDAGWSRAALPFALIEANANCTHNGVLTFLFRDGVVSRVAYEIASETCQYAKFDLWGVSTASLGATTIDTIAAVEADRDVRGHQMPVAPFSALAASHPRLIAANFASPAEIDPADLTTFGVVYQGVHYRGGCDTRAGAYPFCEALLLPSYSLAKTLVGGLGLMRLEQLHPGAMQAGVSAYVPQCADWAGVSFENALDMATGRYALRDSEADENALIASRFFLSETHEEKIRVACNLYPRREAPGLRWVYHTPDTYVLGTAMSAYWRAETGATHDFFSDVVADGIYRPLHLSEAALQTRRTYDAARQPFTGWGLTLLPDDIAKLADFMNVSSRLGQTLVAQAPLDGAMQRAPSDPGLSAAAADLRYNQGVWAWDAQTALGCDAPAWIPFMSGYGGIVVAMMPNGLTYYYVSDGGAYRWAEAARAANRIAPFCEHVTP